MCSLNPRNYSNLRLYVEYQICIIEFVRVMHNYTIFFPTVTPRPWTFHSKLPFLSSHSSFDPHSLPFSSYFSSFLHPSSISFHWFLSGILCFLICILLPYYEWHCVKIISRNLNSTSYMLSLNFPFFHIVISKLFSVNTIQNLCCVDVFIGHEYQLCKYAMFC